ncbi:hypothetical protein [Agriterribacter sp.]|uniref:hypothetical protein n=1 Tax=Agriterribacter sp. TaxID=2821509 RepID=UPI002C49F90F|nr:hypothetical protein [Agriterribacter sp.]HRO47178.1 hypothetical protein [Agriterribacter sp.]HRQ18705.1 hypothetical protein [Agriterribacter sp.]
MKRLTGILLLSLHILAYTECHQLLRIPYLMQHFQQHRTADPHMNFSAFIKIHYLEPVKITDDFKQDQQLPFRNVDCHMINSTVCIYEPATVEIDPPVEIPAVFYCYNETNKPQFSSFGIFQPPRQACII